MGLLKRILRPLKRWARDSHERHSRLRLHPMDALPVTGGRRTLRGDHFHELIPGARSRGSRKDFTLPAVLSQEEIRWAHVSPQAVKPLGYFRLHDVSLRGAGYVLKNARLCHAPSIIPDYLSEILEADPARVLGTRKLQARRLSRPALLFAVHDYNNYMHWWMECAPRIYPLWLHAPELLKELAWVIPADLSPWCRDTLGALFGIDASRFVVHEAGSETLSCAEAILPTLVHSNFHFHPEAEDFYRHAIRVSGAGLAGKGGSGRLFLTRRHSAKGRILANIADVEALAASLGFEVIAPEMLSWRDQIRLFSRVRIVAGEHGAAMKNLLFAPRDTVAVVINYVNPSQATLAALKQQRCIIVGVEGGTSGYGERLTVDVSKLKISLEHGLRLAGF